MLKWPILGRVRRFHQIEVDHEIFSLGRVNDTEMRRLLHRQQRTDRLRRIVLNFGQFGPQITTNRRNGSLWARSENAHFSSVQKLMDH